ncbi:MAG: hypothetical protein ACREFQ_21585 [Stellaceae bacterium]
MKRSSVLLALTVALALGAQAAARADCRDDMKVLQHRLAAAPNQKAPNIARAKQALVKAQSPNADEVACDNALARAWRYYREQPPEKDAQQQP